MNVAANPAGRLTFRTNSNAAHLSRLTRQGSATRLAAGVYVIDATLVVEAIARHHLYELTAHFWPGAVVTDRSALAGGQPQDGWLFVAHPDPPRAGDLSLPGLTISPRVGPGRLPGDTSLPAGLWLSGPARSLVENVTRRGRTPIGRPARSAGTASIGDRIDDLARSGGAGRIQRILQELDVIASHFDFSQVAVVRAHLVSVLGTITGSSPPSGRLRARLAGSPFDQHRLELVQGLLDVLSVQAPAPRPLLPPTERWVWLPFFEAYFSNYIEGTEFGVEVARRIVTEGFVDAQRPEDSHDVQATYRLVSDPLHSVATPRTPDQFIDILLDRHSVLLAARPEKHPGRFKQVPNFAGGYRFVESDLLEGTLRQGFEMMNALSDSFGRSAALMALITECHPFDDGNGRIARIMANAELSAAGEVRIVIPTIFRSDYLSALSGFSNQAGRGESLVAVLRFAQQWVAAVDWSTFGQTDGIMNATNAYLEVEKWPGRRLLMPS